MKRVVFSFVVGVVAGALGHWYLQQDEGKRAVAEARARVSAGTEFAREAVLQGAEDIKEELSRTGKVIRDKVTGNGPAATNTTVTRVAGSTLQTRLRADPGLATSTIHVETTNGVVTLTGTVPSHEQIGAAMKLALETEGVQRVVSLLQVSSAR
jgi:osmotically-inducible protein OsmY